MIYLLELPMEVLGIIFGFLVMNASVKTAVKFRITCKAFDREISKAIWTTRALEDEDEEISIRCGEYVLADYLLARTLADRVNQQYPLTSTIFDTIAYLQRVGAISPNAGLDYLREACLSIARDHKQPRLRGNGYILINKCELSKTQAQAEQESNALAFATHLGLTSVMERLIMDGTTDVRTVFGSPLICAATHRDPLVATTYLNAKLDLNMQSNLNATTHARSVQREVEKECVSRIQHRGIMARDYHDALHQAICFGVPKIVEALINAATSDNEYIIYHFYAKAWPRFESPSIPSIRKYTVVLLIAVRNNRLEVARLALDRGADPDGFDRWCGGNTALEYAAENGSVPIFELLVERGAVIHPRYRERRSLFWSAMKGGSMKIVKACLDAGLGWCQNTVLDHRFHPLVVAARSNHPDLLQLLGAYGITFESGSALETELLKVIADSPNSELTSVIDSLRKPESA